MNWESLLHFSIPMLLFWIFAGTLLLLLLYYFVFFIRVATWKRPAVLPEEQLPAVSVVICARNEDDNLVKFLPVVLNQHYPKYEVVVVNDCSFDNTGDVLKEFAGKHANLKIVTIKEDEYYSHGKKFALTVGIKGTQYGHLLLTDADCVPAGENWLRSMASHFITGKELVLGYGGYMRAKGFLNKIIRFDTAHIALQYFSFALARIPYMGVGRNLAYTADLYYRNKGFKSHYHIPSGDDDLFVNQAANSRNVRVEISPESFTHSPAKKTFKEWRRQKKRHLMTGKRYRFSHKLLLALYPFTQLLFWGLFTALLVLWYQPWLVLGILGFRWLVYLLIMNKVLGKLGERDLLVYSPLIELILLFFYPIIGVTRLFQRKSRWK